MKAELKKSDLTKKQREVVEDLIGGAVLITDSEMKGALVATSEMHYHINNGVFDRLVNKGFIWQELSSPFDYVLTQDAINLYAKQ